MGNQEDLVKFMIGIAVIIAGALIVIRAIDRIIEVQILGRL